jgi:CO dehydrogenase/acetyl-CoA synthase alpha subunit
MTRDEHLAWAKKRALAYVERRELLNAHGSFVSDLSKHDELAVLLKRAIREAHRLIGGELSTPRAMREWIESFEVGPPAFVCPRCTAVSYNLNDAKNRYCARCHTFVDDQVCPRCEGDRQVCNECGKPGARCTCPSLALPTPMPCPVCSTPGGTKP